MQDKPLIHRPPVLYLPHGGGPLPLLGDVSHKGLVTFMRHLAPDLGSPSAILIISAHWEEPVATITGGVQPGLLYDYYGFPEESYSIEYPAPGAPQLAQEIEAMLQASGIEARLDNERGFDHGLFVPLKMIYPQAGIPCLQLSLLSHMKPSDHIELGRALASLRDKNVLVIGSGMSFHNLPAIFSPEPAHKAKAAAFDHWLTEVCCSAKIPAEEREWQLINWEEAPFARFCHPREEHLLPLHVCYGIACDQTPTAEVIFNQELMGKQVSALRWG